MNITYGGKRRNRTAVYSTPYNAQSPTGLPRATIARPALRAAIAKPYIFLRTPIPSSATNPPPGTPGITRPPIVSAAAKRARLAKASFLIRSPWTNTPPIPASGKPIIALTARQARRGPFPASLIRTPRDTMLDKVPSRGVFVVPTVRRPAKGGSRVVPVVMARDTSLATGGARLRVTLGPVARTFPYVRRPLATRTPFYPATMLPGSGIEIQLGRGARRSAKLAGVLRTTVYAPPITPRAPVIGPTWRTDRRQRTVFVARSSPAFIPSRPPVIASGRIPKPRPKPPVTLQTPRFSQWPGPPIIARTPAQARRKATEGRLLRASSGGQPGNQALSLILVAKRPAVFRLAMPPTSLRSRTGAGGIIIPPHALIFPALPKRIRLATPAVLRTLPASPRFGVLMPVPLVVKASSRFRPGPPLPTAIHTPTTAAGLAPDFPAAAMAWLIAANGVTTAFGRTATDERFHADEADPATAYPFLVYQEPGGDREYVSDGSFVETGEFQINVVAAGKKQARDLGRLVANSLDDAPLEFADGSLMFLRKRRYMAPPLKETGAGDNEWQYKQIVMFDYKYEGHI